jgi:hypothetical protein
VAIGKLRRRIQELEQLDVVTSVQRDTGAVTVCRSNIRDTIREIFGPNSLESKEYGHIDIWAGPIHMNMQRHDIVASTQRGRTKVVGILDGLIRRLEEKKMDLAAGHDVVAFCIFRSHQSACANPRCLPRSLCGWTSMGCGLRPRRHW